MACKFVCDGCGKEEQGTEMSLGIGYIKPFKWFQRKDDDGVQDACCRECIEKIAEKSGKTSVVAPF